MKSQLFPAISVTLLTLTLAACSSTNATSPGAALPAMPSYSEEFRAKFADEVDHICGNSEKGMPGEYKNSCIFIQDALVLRKQLKAIKESE